MDKTGTCNAEYSTPHRREDASLADGPHRVQEVSEESSPTGDSPSWTSVTGAGSPLHEQALRQRGRFTLTRGAEGFCWVLMSKDGCVWYWHPEGRRWIANCRAYGTEKQATAGLEEALSHEQVGDLDEQHVLVESLLPDRGVGRTVC
jgi:hypothetical protein